MKRQRTKTKTEYTSKLHKTNKTTRSSVLKSVGSSIMNQSKNAKILSNTKTAINKPQNSLTFEKNAQDMNLITGNTTGALLGTISTLKPSNEPEVSKVEKVLPKEYLAEALIHPRTDKNAPEYNLLFEEELKKFKPIPEIIDKHTQTTETVAETYLVQKLLSLIASFLKRFIFASKISFAFLFNLV